MKAGWNAGVWISAVRRWIERPPSATTPIAPPRIGLALGGGFARGIAHAGVLKVLVEAEVPIHCITGVSAGAIVAAAFASGTTPDEIATVACKMRFADVARWSICRMGFVGNERMTSFLQRLLKCHSFDEMKIPLGVVATDLRTGDPVSFRDHGDVCMPIRASCSYPGLFRPIEHQQRLLVDGAMSMEIAAPLARDLGATHVIAVHLPTLGAKAVPNNVFQVVSRCFQIMQVRSEESWRGSSDLVISPEVRGIEWDAFQSAVQMIQAGEQAAREALPRIRAWLTPPEVVSIDRPRLRPPAGSRISAFGTKIPAGGSRVASGNTVPVTPGGRRLCAL